MRILLGVRLAALTASLGLSFGISGTAHAAEAPAAAPDLDAAGRHFTLAQDCFAKKLYKSAATEFEAAYGISKDPLLLYNIGEAWQKAGDGKKAVASYKAYLKAQPQAQDKADVALRVKTITAKKFKVDNQSAPGDDPAKVIPEAQAAMAAAAAKPVEPVKPPAEEAKPALMGLPEEPAPKEKTAEKTAEKTPPLEKIAEKAPEPAVVAAPKKEPEKEKVLLDDAPASKLKIGAWIGVAATVAVLTTGAILGLAAQSRADEISRRFNFVDSNGQPRVFDMSQQTEYQNLKNEGNLYNGLAIGFFAGAGALAIATAVMFGIDYKHQKEGAAKKTAFRLAPHFGPQGAGLSAGGSF